MPPCPREGTGYIPYIRIVHINKYADSHCLNCMSLYMFICERERSSVIIRNRYFGLASPSSVTDDQGRR